MAVGKKIKAEIAETKIAIGCARARDVKCFGGEKVLIKRGGKPVKGENAQKKSNENPCWGTAQPGDMCK